jgi:hypothetical protein
MPDPGVSGLAKSTDIPVRGSSECSDRFACALQAADGMLRQGSSASHHNICRSKTFH